MHQMYRVSTVRVMLHAPLVPDNFGMLHEADHPEPVRPSWVCAYPYPRRRMDAAARCADNRVSPKFPVAEFDRLDSLSDRDEVFCILGPQKKLLFFLPLFLPQ